MVVLIKIKSATLIEAIVATVIIVVIFIVSSLVINNLLLNQFSNDTHQIDTRLNELEYEICNHQIKLPYDENYANWEIKIQKQKNNPRNIDWIKFTALKINSNKTIIRTRSYEQD